MCLFWQGLLPASEYIGAMEQNDNPGQLILTLLLDEVRRVVRDELSSFRKGLQPDVSRTEPLPERKRSAIKEAAMEKRTAPERKRFYTMKEAAAELSFSTKTVRRLIDRGLLRPSRATRRIRISNEELENFARSTM